MYLAIDTALKDDPGRQIILFIELQADYPVITHIPQLEVDLWLELLQSFRAVVNIWFAQVVQVELVSTLNGEYPVRWRKVNRLKPLVAPLLQLQRVPTKAIFGINS